MKKDSQAKFNIGKQVILTDKAIDSLSECNGYDGTIGEIIFNDNKLSDKDVVKVRFSHGWKPIELVLHIDWLKLVEKRNVK